MHNRTHGELDFEWDLAKADANRARHGIRFSEAALVLEDSLAWTIPDPGAAPEERFVTLGADALGRLLVVVWTPRGRRIRLISARRATSWERRRYEEER